MAYYQELMRRYSRRMHYLAKRADDDTLRATMAEKTADTQRAAIVRLACRITLRNRGAEKS